MSMHEGLGACTHPFWQAPYVAIPARGPASAADRSQAVNRKMEEEAKVMNLMVSQCLRSCQ